MTPHTQKLQAFHDALDQTIGTEWRDGQRFAPRQAVRLASGAFTPVMRAGGRWVFAGPSLYTRGNWEVVPRRYASRWEAVDGRRGWVALAALTLMGAGLCEAEIRAFGASDSPTAIVAQWVQDRSWGVGKHHLTRMRIIVQSLNQDRRPP